MAKSQITLTLDTAAVDAWLEGLKTAVGNADLCLAVEALLDAGDPLWDINPADLRGGTLTLRVVPNPPLSALLAKYGVVLDGTPT